MDGVWNLIHRASELPTLRHPTVTALILPRHLARKEP